MTILQACPPKLQLRPYLWAFLLVAQITSLLRAQSPQTIASSVSKETYTSHLNDKLFTATGHRNSVTVGTTKVPSNNHDLARDGIRDHFASLGLVTKLDPVPEWTTGTSPTVYTWTGWKNVVGVKYGAVTPERIYIVGGHYDSVSCPGADDNASGVAAVMEAARVLSNYTFESTLVFIAWDAEDTKGHKGSLYDADSRKSLGQDVRAVVNMDMVAYNSENGKVWVSSANKTTCLDLQTRLIQAINTYSTGLAPVTHGDMSSDQASYSPTWAANLLIEPNPASNPNYHKKGDSILTTGYIDYAYATEITRAVVGFLAENAVVVPNTSASAEFQQGALPDAAYLGVQDSYLESTNPATVRANQSTLSLRNVSAPNLRAVIKWDISAAVPSTATITQATLRFVQDAAKTAAGGTVQAYALKRDWVGSEATWSNYAAALAWQTAGAKGADDVDGVLLGSATLPNLAGAEMVLELNADGIAYVQSWLADPSANKGFLLARTDGGARAYLSSSQSTTAAARPKLSLQFTTP